MEKKSKKVKIEIKTRDETFSKIIELPIELWTYRSNYGHAH